MKFQVSVRGYCCFFHNDTVITSISIDIERERERLQNHLPLPPLKLCWMAVLYDEERKNGTMNEDDFCIYVAPRLYINCMYVPKNHDTFDQYMQKPEFCNDNEFYLKANKFDIGLKVKECCRSSLHLQVNGSVIVCQMAALGLPQSSIRGVMLSQVRWDSFGVEPVRNGIVQLGRVSTFHSGALSTLWRCCFVSAQEDAIHGRPNPWRSVRLTWNINHIIHQSWQLSE